MREKICFDEDWLFHYGDFPSELPPISGIYYVTAKTERIHFAPASKEYRPFVEADRDAEMNYDVWERVTLPHDFVIGGIPDHRYPNEHGFLPYGKGWYLKSFTLPPSDAGRRITLYFEGVATHATVYLNGCLVKRNFSGYASFEADITDLVRFDAENKLAVLADADPHEGWWYEGGGIYRHVFLVKTDLVAVDLYGIYAHPESVGGGKWNVPVEVTVRNDDVIDCTTEVCGRIVDAAGRAVAVASGEGRVLRRDKATIVLGFEVSDPNLWSPDEPNMYRVEVTVSTGGDVRDEQSVRFGFRTFTLDPARGLFINGKHYKIKGVCGHADCGLLGKAVPDNVHRYKVKLMKEMGANGYRTSHYMQAEALMDALDENGFIVLDETRRFESNEEGLEQLTTLVKRDRNRPGVFFWSMGNEEPMHCTDEGRRICRTMIETVRKLDDRPVLAAVNRSPDKAPVYDIMDVIGINYNWDKYEDVHAKFPNKLMFASECAATATTRGWYSEDNTKYISAYDHDSTEQFRSREFTWKFIAERDWLAGSYQWIAFEHRGEARWPLVCSQSGAIDLFMQKKDAFYQNMSHWTDPKSHPMLHVLPHWNHVGMEGVPIRVVAYTNLPKVELLLNGRSAGVREVERYGHAEFSVPFEAGRLEAVGYDENGAEAARDERVTTGRAAKLALSLDTADVRARTGDVAIFSCFTLDENGNEVPDAECTVSFEAIGAGKVLSTGSDVADHDTVFDPVRRMRAGRIGVAVRMQPGDSLTLIARSPNLLPAICKINFNN